MDLRSSVRLTTEFFFLNLVFIVFFSNLFHDCWMQIFYKFFRYVKICYAKDLLRK